MSLPQTKNRGQRLTDKAPEPRLQGCQGGGGESAGVEASQAADVVDAEFTTEETSTQDEGQPQQSVGPDDEPPM